MAYIGSEPNPGQNREVDDISSSFNGSTTAFTLQVASQNVSPGSSNAIIVSLGGVIQNPGTDYTIAASTITFTTAPASGLSFFGLVLGQGVDTSQPADGSVTSAKIANGAIVNADVNASAAIVGTKISPDFGSQDLVTTGNLDLSDSTGSGNNRIRLGTGDDLHIYFDGSNSFIKEPNATAGQLLIDGYNGTDIRRGSDGANMIRAIGGGSVELYHNNVKKFMTKSNGMEGFGLLSVEATSDSVAQFVHSSSGDTIGIIMRHGRGGLAGFSGKMISFRGNDNTEEGSVVIGTTNTAFNTSSDYRLKENETSISNPITKLKTLKPYTFNFKKEPDVKVDGFFAHEVSSVVPVAVTGTKDETEDILYTEEDTIPSGKKVGDVKETVPRYQGIDQSKLVPLLTAALQEAVTKIETLETKVAALEAA